MTHLPLPEAIRGCWFFIPDASPQTQSGQKNSSIIHFNLNGSFERFQIKDNTRKTLEQGTYTFDGKFLILRGRNTDTFRVSSTDFHCWNLEGKKEGQALVRAYPSQVIDAELSSADKKEIHHLPTRITVDDTFTHALPLEENNGGSNGIYQLKYQPQDQDPQNIANFFVEFHSESRLWIGLSPFLTDIDPTTWQHIINDSFLNTYLSQTPEKDTVTLLLLDTDQTQTFHYKNP